MSLFDEINQELINGKDAFIRFINAKLKSDKNLLSQFFITPKGKQQTILDYLIHLHSKEQNVAEHIQWLLQQGIDINVNQPLHLVFQLQKFDLVTVFLNEQVLTSEQRQKLNVDSRDAQGKTLIHRVIESRMLIPLEFIVKLGVQINQPSQTLMGKRAIEVQPVHQAVISDFPEAIPLLTKAGAQFANPCGRLMETPLLLAARMGRINVMKGLLDHAQELDLEKNQALLNATNSKGLSAMELLCIHLHDNKQPKEALRGIAMLMCHGVNAPPHPLLRSLLTDNRQALHQVVKEYTQDKPKLAINFLRKCHNKRDPLHDIMYAKNSWGQSMRHLFGKADDLAFKLEALIELPKRKTAMPEEAESNQTGSSVVETILTEEELLFANFVAAYKDSIKGATLFNPWSEMLHLIAMGEVTCWAHVTAYSDMHPKSRTERIVKHMMQSQPSLHENLDPEVTCSKV
ncbi:Dot/Icm T4SS effector AnkC/LegA12 [Legionella brunensis]|nr:Dot/Icm T4SS effector AnkC/LegA12 [Legionella brunensis]